MFGLVRFDPFQRNPRLSNQLVMSQFVFITHGQPEEEERRGEGRGRHVGGGEEEMRKGKGREDGGRRREEKTGMAGGEGRG